MADLNLDIHYFDHIKTKRLIVRLGSGSEVLPIRLWCYVAQHYAKDGRLTGHTAEEIESAIHWWGKKGECTASLHEIGFLDLQKGVYSVHGWKERSGHLVAYAERASRAAKVRWANERARCLKHEQALLKNDLASLPNPTQPNPPTNPTNPTQPGEHRARGSGGSAENGNGMGGMGRELNAAANVFETAKKQRILESLNPPMNADRKIQILGRKDITAAKLQAMLDDIKDDPKISDPAGVISYRLGYKPNQRRQ